MVILTNLMIRNVTDGEVEGTKHSLNSTANVVQQSMETFFCSLR